MLSPTCWYVAVTPIDLRCGIDRLLVKVQAELGRDARDGAAYVFHKLAINWDINWDTHDLASTGGRC